MIVLTFKPRFRPKVLDRTKVNTIRADRKRPVKVGDALSLRGWSGAPYRSKQVIVLGGQRCTRTCPVIIWPLGYEIDGVFWDNPVLLADFAVRDGFTDWADLVAYFQDNGGLPFRGTLIGWAP